MERWMVAVDRRKGGQQQQRIAFESTNDERSPCEQPSRSHSSQWARGGELCWPRVSPACPRRPHGDRRIGRQSDACKSRLRCLLSPNLPARLRVASVNYARSAEHLHPLCSPSAAASTLIQPLPRPSHITRAAQCTASLLSLSLPHPSIQRHCDSNREWVTRRPTQPRRRNCIATPRTLPPIPSVLISPKSPRPAPFPTAMCHCHPTPPHTPPSTAPPSPPPPTPPPATHSPPPTTYPATPSARLHRQPSHTRRWT